MRRTAGHCGERGQGEKFCEPPPVFIIHAVSPILILVLRRKAL
jgi:hypothetical protein